MLVWREKWVISDFSVDDVLGVIYYPREKGSPREAKMAFSYLSCICYNLDEYEFVGK